MTPYEIFEQAKAAALAAATAQNATLPPEARRGFDCGFAWVIIKPARGPFVKYCKANRIGDKHCYGGWNIWYSHFSLPTQSVSVHEAAASAFAAVLVANGIDAYADSRLD